MTASPHELDRLLAGEIARRLACLTHPDTPEREVQGVLHSLKGSAAMAGHADLALVIAQFGQRLRAGEAAALEQIRLLFEHALSRLTRDLPPFASAWPEPPPFLVAARIDSKYRAEYSFAIVDRLSELDGVLVDDGDPLAALERAQRGVHAMKGAAAALGDDVLAWYCHGLEAALRERPRHAQAAADALLDLARHRAMLSLLLEDPERGLSTLRALMGSSQKLVPPAASNSASRRSTERNGTRDAPGPSHLKVPAHTLDAFNERLERLDLVYEELLRSGDLARKLAARLRQTGVGLSDARRQLVEQEPATPKHQAWARIEMASLLLRTSATNAERGAGIFRRNAEFLRARTTEMRSELSALRRTSLHALFERVKRATLRDAESEGKVVVVEITGPDAPIDQRAAERLHDVLLQLSRNALVHGIEAPPQRKSAGKAEAGLISLSAEQIGEWLRITVQDDGRGVEVARIRELAVDAGAVSREAAERAKEDELLALLFFPGLTTHATADLLAGRGLGLDLVRDTVRRLGGSIRLRSPARAGLSASIEMPSDHTVIDVLWVEEMGHRFALPVSFTGQLGSSDPTRPAVRLARCLGQACPRHAAVSLELTVYGIAPIQIAFDAAGEIEQVGLRALPEFISKRGPYSGAVLRADGSLQLVLDAPLIAARAWTLRPTDPS